MPTYYVYSKDTGDVVHVHETYDVESGMSITETEEEILNFVDDEYDVDKLAIAVADSAETQSIRNVSVDVNTGQLISSNQ